MKNLFASNFDEKIKNKSVEAEKPPKTPDACQNCGATDGTVWIDYFNNPHCMACCQPTAKALVKHLQNKNTTTDDQLNQKFNREWTEIEIDGRTGFQRRDTYNQEFVLGITSLNRQERVQDALKQPEMCPEKPGNRSGLKTQNTTRRCE